MLVTGRSRAESRGGLRLWAAATLCLTAMHAQGAEPSAGKAIFRSNCAFCHGGDARGGRGPNLVSVPLSHGESDDAIQTVIREGVPGTSMPAFSGFTPEELAAIVSYLRSLSQGVQRQSTVPGDAARGLTVYQANGCSGCHRIGSEGSVFGPDLSRIGTARSVEYLRESVVNPSADVPEEYQGVIVVTQDGRSVSGIRVNEDTFSVQLRGADQRFRMFQKSSVREVRDAEKSLMPAYTQLAPADLRDLLAYLDSLRGPSHKNGNINKAAGIK